MVLERSLDQCVVKYEVWSGEKNDSLYVSIRYTTKYKTQTVWSILP